MSDADALLALLTGSSPQGPVEESGATAVFSRIAGTGITAVMRSRRARRLTRRQQVLLQADGITAGHERHGVLYAGPELPVAVTTAVLVPQRIPVRVRVMLGIGPAGAVLPAEADMPLGRALAGHGARREHLAARIGSGSCDDGDGNQVVIWSAARLWIGSTPVAVVTEHVLAAFLAAFPGPWDQP